VLSIRLARSSGNAAYDAAVERAILKSSPLPLPASRELFSRELKLTFRPRD
jgi:colicin import membrane protein